MKKFLLGKLFLFCVLCIMFFSVSVSGNVITAPIDSRPVSFDYLRNLAALNNEDFFAPDKDILDLFPANVGYSRFAKSKPVREQIRGKVAESDNEDTTVIINLSSYMTGGLVGSRCGDNYKDFNEALDELYSLASEYKNPSYYVNLSMPRTLPETRLNSIWRDNKNCRGMGYYYIKNNPECEDRVYIGSEFSNITPTQLIMEWSYVENKKNERGENSLMIWEKEFLNYFNKVYKQMEPYRTYLSKYIMPFSSVSEAFSKLMKMQKDGIIDEIIVSNDDFQIPNFITYFNTKNAEWIPREKGNPIKFSFARNYITNGPRCIYKLLKDERGANEAKKALSGNSESINFIFGTDEIPQLIYARDLSKRKNLSADFNIINTENASKVDTFDVISGSSLIRNSVNFVGAGKEKTSEKIDLYLFSYGNKNISAADIINKMEESKKDGKSIGLIELYDSGVLSSGENYLFKKLLYNAEEKNGGIGINELACYSAWNTNANAIGLGVAHAQVYGIMKQEAENKGEFLKNHLNVLAIHCSEDGFYTAWGKRKLTSEGMSFSQADTIKSERLLPYVGQNEVEKAFKGGKYIIDGNEYEVEDFYISDYSFPWGRLFECCLGFECKIKNGV